MVQITISTALQTLSVMLTILLNHYDVYLKKVRASLKNESDLRKSSSTSQWGTNIADVL